MNITGLKVLLSRSDVEPEKIEATRLEIKKTCALILDRRRNTLSPVEWAEVLYLYAEAAASAATSVGQESVLAVKAGDIVAEVRAFRPDLDDGFIPDFEKRFQTFQESIKRKNCELSPTLDQCEQIGRLEAELVVARRRLYGTKRLASYS